MHIFIKFLIFTLRTVDGKANSAKGYLDYVTTRQIDKIKRFTKTKMPKVEKIKLIKLNENTLFEKIARKYFVLKIRLKISFMACRAGQTVSELFYNAILKSYSHFVNIGSIIMKKEDHADDENFLKNNLFKFKMKDVIELSSSVHLKNKAKMIDKAENEVVIINVKSILNKDKSSALFAG